MAPTLMSAQGTKTALLPRLTEEEYLRLDRAATEKSEFLNGQMYAMAGGFFNHFHPGWRTGRPDCAAAA